MAEKGALVPSGFRRVSGAERRQFLEAHNRQPFRDVLDDLLEAKPEVEALQQWARKTPDRWGQAVAIFARLGGYHEKLQVEHEVRPENLSLAELLERLEGVEEQVRSLGGAAKIVEAFEITEAEVNAREQHRIAQRRSGSAEAPAVKDLKVEGLDLE